MKREDVSKIIPGITSDQLDSIMNLHGADITAKVNEITTLKAEKTTLTEQLSTANSKLEGYDPEWKAKAEQAKATTGDAAVDSLILRGQQLLEQIRSENDRLPEPEISEQIDTIESIANQIFKAVIEQPKKAPQIRRFMDYYLPTTLKMLVAFRRMEEEK